MKKLFRNIVSIVLVLSLLSVCSPAKEYTTARVITIDSTFIGNDTIIKRGYEDDRKRFGKGEIIMVAAYAALVAILSISKATN